MTVRKIAPVLLCSFFVLFHTPAWGAVKHKKTAPRRGTGPAVLWRNPADIQSRDLFYGPGGKEHMPHGPFTFVKEDLEGTNPKYVVRDADGHKWKAKIGIEARPETVASRIVWAVGYFTADEYLIPSLQVRDMPAHLHRGGKLIGPNGELTNVRLKREPAEEKLGEWEWREEPFLGTRELNGLKVIMALINNWDLKDENNAVYEENGEQVYMVSDLGASFGSAGRSWPRDRAKGNLRSYQQSRFIRQVTETTVDFQVPARPRFVYLVDPKEYFSRLHLESIGRHVPKADVQWMGRLLARLSPKQIRDAFRAGAYSPEETGQFARVVERRIAELTSL